MTTGKAILSHRNEILLFATTWKDLKGIVLSEMSDKDKYHMISLKCGIQKTSEQTPKQKQSHRYREQVVAARREGLGGGTKQVSELNSLMG